MENKNWRISDLLWILAEPLIKDWIQENMGPDKIILNAVGEVADSLRRLPVIVSNMEKNMAVITKNGIKLSSDSVQKISEPNKTKKTYINLLYITLILALLGQLILA